MVVKATELVTTGCVDCGIVQLLPKDLPTATEAGFSYGNAAVRMWKCEDGKHNVILVHGRPSRMFLSCQPYAKLLTVAGVAAVLNFVERIKPEQEVL